MFCCVTINIKQANNNKNDLSYPGTCALLNDNFRAQDTLIPGEGGYVFVNYDTIYKRCLVQFTESSTKLLFKSIFIATMWPSSYYLTSSTTLCLFSPSHLQQCFRNGLGWTTKLMRREKQPFLRSMFPDNVRKEWELHGKIWGHYPPREDWTLSLLLVGLKKLARQMVGVLLLLLCPSLMVYFSSCATYYLNYPTQGKIIPRSAPFWWGLSSSQLITEQPQI